MNCSCEGCSQSVYNPDEKMKSEPLCYFHAKQRDGLIPVEDREYYLSPSDMATLDKYKKRNKYWSKYGLRYRPWVLSKAKKFSEWSGVDFDDLAQEGLALMWTVCSFVNPNKTAKQIVSYLKKSVHGQLMKTIAKAHDNLTISLDTITENNEIETIGYQKSPEELAVRSEELAEAKSKAMRFATFFNSLDKNEKKVLQQCIINKNPTTVREAANKIGVKSPQTIVNIRNRVIQKAKEYYSC